MKYQDYIWDLGGTLLDNYETSTRAFAETLAYFGQAASHEHVYEALKVSTDHATALFASEFPNFREKYKEYEAKLLDYPALFEGAEELLATVVEQGGRNFLVSHRDKQVLKILEVTGILSYFTEVVTGDQAFPRKPDPTSMLYLVDKYSIEQGLAIGDRDLDIKAGQAAGLATYFFDDMAALAKFASIKRNK